MKCTERRRDDPGSDRKDDTLHQFALLRLKTIGAAQWCVGEQCIEQYTQANDRKDEQRDTDDVQVYTIQLAYYGALSTPTRYG